MKMLVIHKLYQSFTRPLPIPYLSLISHLPLIYPLHLSAPLLCRRFIAMLAPVRAPELALQPLERGTGRGEVFADGGQRQDLTDL